MKSTLAILALAAIIGFAFATAPSCTGNPCRLCRNTNFSVTIQDKEDNDNADYQYDACFIISEAGDEYTIEVEMKKGFQYKNTYQMDKEDNLPCIEPKNKADDKISRMCPYVYDVDLSSKTKTICVKMVEELNLKNTQVEHEVNFGCAKF